MQVFTYFLNNSKTLGTVSVTVNEVSKSRRTGSWASITYMNIWAQQQVLRVSVLEKKRQKLWLHWQAQVQWDSNLKTWFGATKEDDVDLWPPRAHTPPPPPHTHPPPTHRSMFKLRCTHTKLQHILNKTKICRSLLSQLCSCSLFSLQLYVLIVLPRSCLSGSSASAFVATMLFFISSFRRTLFLQPEMLWSSLWMLLKETFQ